MSDVFCVKVWNMDGPSWEKQRQHCKVNLRFVFYIFLLFYKPYVLTHFPVSSRLLKFPSLPFPSLLAQRSSVVLRLNPTFSDSKSPKILVSPSRPPSTTNPITCTHWRKACVVMSLWVTILCSISLLSRWRILLKRMSLSHRIWAESGTLENLLWSSLRTTTVAWCSSSRLTLTTMSKSISHSSFLSTIWSIKLELLWL